MDAILRKSIFGIIQDFFRDDDWTVQQLGGRLVLRMLFSGKNGQWACYAQAREQEEQFIFYSVCMTNCPEARRQALSEFLTRANYGLFMGNFEMDFADGEIRFKTSIDVEGDRLTGALCRQVVYCNCVMMDRYLPGIMAVMFTEIPPEQAVRQIEDDGQGYS